MLLVRTALSHVAVHIHFADGQFAEIQFADRTVGRQETLPIGQFADRRVCQWDISPIRQSADRMFCRQGGWPLERIIVQVSS